MAPTVATQGEAAKRRRRNCSIYARAEPGFETPEKAKETLEKSPNPYFRAFAGKVVPINERKGPECRVTEQICKDFGVRPENAVMYGDHLVDAQSANKAGANFVWDEEGARIDQRTLDVWRQMSVWTPQNTVLSLWGHDQIGAVLDKLRAENPNFKMDGVNGMAELMQRFGLASPALAASGMDATPRLAPGLVTA